MNALEDLEHRIQERLDGTVVGGSSYELHVEHAAAAIAARRDLWHNGWSFLLIVCVLGGEWLLRRRWGLT